MNIHFLTGMIISLFYFSSGLFMFKRACVKGSYYGYRTAIARKNMDTWIEANVFAGRTIMIMGVMSILLQLLLNLYFPGPGKYYPFVFGSIIIGTAIMYFITERHLRKLFFRDGRRKPFY